MKTRRADDLLIGNVIIEISVVKKKAKMNRYKVTSVKVAACDPNKTHVIIDGQRTWCYDSAFPVMLE